MNLRAARLRGLGSAIFAIATTSCRDLVAAPGGNADSRVLWRVASAASTNHTPHDAAANADHSMVYFVTTDYRLKKVRGLDGNVVWDVDVGPVYGTYPEWNVVLAGSTVAFAKVDIFGYDTTSGQQLWSYVAPGGDETGYTTITAAENTIYSASRGGRAYAIDARTGNARWITDLREGRSDVGALHPTYADGVLYVGTHSTSPPEIGTLWALDAVTGAVKWTYHFTPEFPQQAPWAYGGAAVWNDLVIEPQADGRVYAFDRQTGTVRWVAPRVHKTWLEGGYSWDDVRIPGVFGDNLAVTSTTGIVVSLDPATGMERWRNSDIPGVTFGRPVVDEQNVYVTYGAIFAAFDVNTGRLRWRDDGPLVQGLPDGSRFQGRPVVASDRLYIGGRDASYALRK